MSLKTKLVNYFLENDFNSIADTGVTWAEIANRIGYSTADAASKAWRRYKMEDSYGKSVEKFAKKRGINPDHITSVQSINKKGKEYFNFHLKKEATEIQLSDIKDLIKSFDFECESVNIQPIDDNGKVLGVNLTDQHCGLEIKDDLYGLSWNEGLLYSRTVEVINHIMSKYDGHSKILINYLGDFCDGMDGKTTRKSAHNLPQNLNNKEQIRQAAYSIMLLVDNLVVETKGQVEIEINNMVNSNHGGVLDFAVGELTKAVLELKYPRILTYNLGENFVMSTKAGDFDLMLTHGYDEKNAKNGLPKYVTAANIDFIRKLMKYNNCEEGKTILMRGDLHQSHIITYDYFDDLLCPAFSPSSAYIQHNYNSNYNGGFILFEVLGDTFSHQKINFK